MAKRPPVELEELLPHDIAHARLIASCVIDLIRKEQPIVPQWLNQKQAAIFLCTSGKALEIRRREGNGPRYSKVSERFVRYHVDDLHTWMKSHQVDEH